MQFVSTVASQLSSSQAVKERSIDEIRRIKNVFMADETFVLLDYCNLKLDIFFN
tara:strand:+ start:1143 stop:1304 length:162 start_codon:yes stop_codon:yes gene_type:complete